MRALLARGRSRTQARRAFCGRAGADEGQIMIMSIGFMVVAILLIITATTITALHLDRVRLWDLADEASRAGASAIDVDAFYSAPGGSAPGSVPISDASVQQAAQDYLERVEHRLERITIIAAYTNDGRTAVVGLSALSRPGLLGWLSGIVGHQDGIPLRVESSARAW